MPSIPHRIPSVQIPGNSGFLKGRLVNLITTTGIQFAGTAESISDNSIGIRDARGHRHVFELSGVSEVVTETRAPVR
ncbi:MAG: hypothetical protein HUU10_05855 [Bacteroidetes bacterium]|nr:hypothetical protein [Bacteroidota bacterium]